MRLAKRESHVNDLNIGNGGEFMREKSKVSIAKSIDRIPVHTRIFAWLLREVRLSSPTGEAIILVYLVINSPVREVSH